MDEDGEVGRILKLTRRRTLQLETGVVAVPLAGCQDDGSAGGGCPSASEGGDTTLTFLAGLSGNAERDVRAGDEIVEGYDAVAEEWLAEADSLWAEIQTRLEE